MGSRRYLLENVRRNPTMLGAAVALAALALAAPSGARPQTPCPPGDGDVLASGNSSGETLAAWAEWCSEGNTEFGYLRGRGTVGTTALGFADLGVFTAPQDLASPSDVALDDAGNGWVVGTYSSFSGYGYKDSGAEYEPSGAWLAARPSGQPLSAPAALARNSHRVDVQVAAAGSGRALVAWTTGASLHVAWASPTGQLTATRIFRKITKLDGLSVDAAGRALVIATKGPAPVTDVGSEIVAIHGSFARGFSPPRTLLRGRRFPRQHVSEFFYEPTVATRPERGVVLASTTLWLRRSDEDYARPERSFLLSVSANATHVRRTQLREHFLPEGIGLVSAQGHTLLALEEGELHRRWRFLSFDSVGRQRATWQLPPGDGEFEGICLASNTAGQVVIGWKGTRSTIGALTGTVDGAHGAANRQPAPAGGTQPACTIDGTGHGTMLWSTERTASGGPAIFAKPITPPGPVIEIAQPSGF